MKTSNATIKWFTAGIAITGLLASTGTFADTGALYWNNLYLKSATGVPDKIDHEYKLTGVLLLKEGDFHKGWATLVGTWDGASQVAKESFIYNGEIQGNVVTQFKCQDDPWIHPINNKAYCMILNINASQSGAQWSINWNSVYGQIERPITSSVVTLQQAQAMSEAAANNQPPPPPPPQNKQLVFNNIEFAMTHTQNIKKPTLFNPGPGQPNTINKDKIRSIDSQSEQTAKITNPGEIRGFNPQPEPPGKAVGNDVITKNIPIITQGKPVSPDGEITSITITPSSNVMVGAKVTVKINGNGSCALIIDTNGASDEGNNIDKFKLPFGNFPRKIWFQAKKTGTFKIQAGSEHPGSHGCKSPGMGGNAQLTVYSQINKSKALLR